ncbi:MYG1 family protein [Ramlibacter alkalitolerans]|uniref:MYG1 family protein n=1 Tax=Ramlibacter alkalitolerans TaxID=2039631 RepID=A0ABS1JNI0_9BURK|nr:MYG1 family protein [Ramlibacter alkalitolerans]
MATHNGSHHADDTFGVAVLTALFPDHILLRIRDPDEIARADFAVDVGGEWDPARGRFDHHQRDFDGARTRLDAQGQPVRAEGYASAGLVWREFGPAYVRQVAERMGRQVDEAALVAIAQDVDSALVRYLDLVDNGEDTVAPGIFGLSELLSLLNTDWMEEQALTREAHAALQVERFREGMALVRRFLDAFLRRKIGQLLAADKVRAGRRLFDGRLLYLPEGGMPWTRVVVEEMPEVQLVLYPDAEPGRHQIRTVPQRPGSFHARLDLPAAWAGLRDEELAAVTGVADAAFCHRNLFIAVARSYEGALRLAAQALGHN